MEDPNEEKVHYVEPTVPFSLYVRLLINLIIDHRGYSRADIEQYTREYETDKIAVSTDKQIAARTKSYLMHLYGRTVIEWATACVFFKILKSKRIRLSVTLYSDKGESTFAIETKSQSHGDKDDQSKLP